MSWLDDTLDYVLPLTRWDVAPQAHVDAFDLWLREPMDFRLSGYYSFVFSEVGTA